MSSNSVSLGSAGIIHFPLEIGSIERFCIICHDDLKWPVFCDQCKTSVCYDCLKTWLGCKEECPTCRKPAQLEYYTNRKDWYGCAKDGRLVEFYCEKCVDCLCRNCLENGENHLRHPIRNLDELRKGTMDVVYKLLESNNAIRVEELKLSETSGTVEDQTMKALNEIRLHLTQGFPLELARNRDIVDKKIKDVIHFVPCGWTKHSYDLPNAEYFEKRVKIDHLQKDKTVFSASDTAGNAWELTVYPNGFSDAKDKFWSVFLKLVRGNPTIYEYKFTIFLATGGVLAEYYALDQFVVGGESLACQRLVQIKEAKAKALDKHQQYELSYGIRQVDLAYGLRCVAALASNKPKKLNYKTFTFAVNNFMAKKLNDRIVFSDVVYDSQNIAWRFRIDCNGHQEQGQYVSLYLELLYGAGGWFDIFIKLVHPLDPARSFRRDLTHKFTIHSNWGVPHFIEQRQISEYLHADQLKFEYGTRPAFYDQSM